MKSLRRSILFWMAALLLVVGVLSSLGTYFYVKGEATGAVDAQLKQIAHFVSTTGISISSPDSTVDVSNPEDLFLIEVWDKQQNLLRGPAKPTGLKPPTHTGFDDPVIVGQQWRSYGLIGAQNLVRVSLAADVSDEQASNAAFQVALPAALVIPLSWLILSFIIDRIFAPLNDATARLRNGDSGEVRSLTEGPFPSEIVPFIGAINGLISNLHENVEKQKQFVSDAAHELRTPLTAISLQIGNLYAHAKSSDLKQRIRTLEQGSQRANDLVNKLLKLAQQDNGNPGQRAEKGDFCEIIAQSLNELRALSQPRGMEVKFNRESSAQIQVPKAEAHGIVEILIENAINYSHDNSEIEIDLQANDGKFRLEVRDRGIGIARGELSRVFERFYRAAPGQVEGSGLGLSIARATAEKLGWKLYLEHRRNGKGTIAIVMGPVA